MPLQTYGSERQYLETINDLSSISANFLDNLKGIDIRPLSATDKGKLEEIIGLVSVAEMSQVKNMELPVRTFSNELTKLAKKFRVVKDNFKGDEFIATLTDQYKKGPEKACGSIISTIDASINYIDSVMAAYSRVDQRRETTLRWIRTILGHHSTDKVRGKAQRCNEILKRLNDVVHDVRIISHDTKLKLLRARKKVKGESATTPNTYAYPIRRPVTTSSTGEKPQLMKDLEERETRRAEKITQDPNT